MFYDLKDKKPKNSGENWVAPNAVVIGDVTLEKNTSVWFNATLRGDIENIHIGEDQMFKMDVFCIPIQDIPLKLVKT